ncbi:MAG: DNA topology modulation protein FlaR [Clostridiales bacterium]|nr:DNA topology modulation protein FlaR [Clostridiales bacterium]
MKIQIIGYSGSGKSTLARQLGEIANLPVLHMDSTHFYGDWQERTAEEQTDIVRNFLATNDSWVIDGNYTSVATERFAMTDVTIFMDFPRLRCFWAAYRRARKYRGTPRPDLPCPDKFDRSFRRWILFDSRTRAFRKKIMGNLNATSGRKVVLKNRRQVKAFLLEFQQSFGGVGNK